MFHHYFLTLDWKKHSTNSYGEFIKNYFFYINEQRKITTNYFDIEIIIHMNI